MRCTTLQLKILMKSEELQIPAAFVTSTGIADLNSNHNIMKQMSKHTPLRIH